MFSFPRRERPTTLIMGRLFVSDATGRCTHSSGEVYRSTPGEMLAMMRPRELS